MPALSHRHPRQSARWTVGASDGTGARGHSKGIRKHRPRSRHPQQTPRLVCAAQQPRVSRAWRTRTTTRCRLTDSPPCFPAQFRRRAARGDTRGCCDEGARRCTVPTECACHLATAIGPAFARSRSAVAVVSQARRTVRRRRPHLPIPLRPSRPAISPASIAGTRIRTRAEAEFLPSKGATRDPLYGEQADGWQRHLCRFVRGASVCTIHPSRVGDAARGGSACETGDGAAKSQRRNAVWDARHSRLGGAACVQRAACFLGCITGGQRRPCAKKAGSAGCWRRRRLAVQGS